jgi:Na+-driven multidrug efflux pump
MPLDAPGNTPVHPVPAVAVPAEASRPALDPRTRRLLEAPIAPLLLRLAWPSIAVMLAMAATGLIETWWVSRLGLVSDDPAMHAAGAQYLRIVGPVFGFFGMGLALYFASQGAGRLLWPLLAGLLRLLIAIGGGWLALFLTGSLAWLFAALALALVAYGLAIAAAVARGVWFRTSR